jgi:hypothetical protein
MKSKVFVTSSVTATFSLAFIALAPGGVSAQIFEDYRDLIDKAYVEGHGVLEYILYNLSGAGFDNYDEPFDMFLRSFTLKLESGGVMLLDGKCTRYVIDYASGRYIADNTVLSINVKRMMDRHKYDVSLTYSENRDGSTTFIINYLNAKGVYEFYSFEAYK